MTVQKTVMLVEDNPADVFLVEEAIRETELPVELMRAGDGEQAIQMIEHFEASPEHSCPSLILLDLNLPKRNGREVLERLRQSAHCGRIPVIIMTSSDSPEDSEAVRQLGVSYYFRKPMDYDEFLGLARIVKEVWLDTRQY